MCINVYMYAGPSQFQLNELLIEKKNMHVQINDLIHLQKEAKELNNWYAMIHMCAYVLILLYVCIRIYLYFYECA